MRLAFIAAVALGISLPDWAAGVETAPVATVTPTSLQFGAVSFGQDGTPQSARLTNHSDDPFGIEDIVVPDGFSATDDCGASLAPLESCVISFNFHPSEATEHNRTATISTTAGPLYVRLRGDDPRSEFWITPAVLDFDRILLGATSSPQTARIVNGGWTDMSLSIGAPGGPFQASHACGAVLSPGAACEVTFTFSPEQAGTFEHYAGVSTNALGIFGPFAVTLRGVGEASPSTAPLRQWITPTFLDFGLFPSGQASPVQSLRLTNTGTQPLSGFQLSNVDLPLLVSHDCGGSVAPGAGCTVTFGFTGASPSIVIRDITIQTSAGQSQITVQGISLRPQVRWTPMELDFGPVEIGSISAPQVVSITNRGGNPIRHSHPPAAPDQFSAETDCPEYIPAGSSCTYTLWFTPIRAGIASGVAGAPTDADSISVSIIGFGEPLFWDGFGD